MPKTEIRIDETTLTEVKFDIIVAMLSEDDELMFRVRDFIKKADKVNEVIRETYTD